MLKSNLCDYNNAYILARDDITIIGHATTQEAFKNCDQKLMEQQQVMLET